MKSVAIKSFTAEMVLEYSMTPNPTHLGIHECTMELFNHEQGAEFGIEWGIPSLNEVVYIGIWTDGMMKVTDYDGVFELPLEAIEFLKENGFNVDKIE